MTAGQYNRRAGIVAAAATITVTLAIAAGMYGLTAPSAAAPTDGPLLIHTDCASTLPTEAQP